MIRSCSMYAIRHGDVLNIPFVAFNDDQAHEIVVAAFDGGAVPFEFDLVRIGTFDVYEGVTGLDFEVIRTYCPDSPEREVHVDEISPSV